MIRLNVFIQVEKKNYDQVVNIAKELVVAAHEQAAHFTTLVPKIQELAAMKLEKFEF